MSRAEYDEAEATAIAGDILNRSYQYGDNLEPLARFYLALVAERDALREALVEIDTLCQVSGLDTLVGRAARKGLAALERTK